MTIYALFKMPSTGDLASLLKACEWQYSCVEFVASGPPDVVVNALTKAQPVAVKPPRYRGGKSNKGISGRALCLQELAKGPRTIDELGAVFEAHMFAPTTAMSTANTMVRRGYARRLDDGRYASVEGGAKAFYKGFRRRGSPMKGTTVPPKYRGPNGETWAGRGEQPRWMREEVARGATVESFRIAENG